MSEYIGYEKSAEICCISSVYVISLFFRFLFIPFAADADFRFRYEDGEGVKSDIVTVSEEDAAFLKQTFNLQHMVFDWDFIDVPSSYNNEYAITFYGFLGIKTRLLMNTDESEMIRYRLGNSFWLITVDPDKGKAMANIFGKYIGNKSVITH